MPQTRSKSDRSSDDSLLKQSGEIPPQSSKRRRSEEKTLNSSAPSTEKASRDSRRPKKKPAERLAAAVKIEAAAHRQAEASKAVDKDIEDLGGCNVPPVTLRAENTWEPPRWAELLEKVRLMRANRDSPVDTMGCHMCANPKAEPSEQRFQILISLLLSAQTKDEVNFAACGRLRERGFTPATLKDLPEDEIAKLIYPVGFYKTKAKNIKAVAEICLNQYDSDIPHSVEELRKLPGIGPKMAFLAMNCAWNETVGIGVDTHVHRLAQRWKWLPRGTTKGPEDTRQQLEQWLPSSLWRELNWLLVGFGQTVCLPVKPRCGDCAANQICPSAFKTK